MKYFPSKKTLGTIIKAEIIKYLTTKKIYLSNC